MEQHAKYAPSAAHRWIACPASIRLCENIDARPSEYALEGTELHRITEICLRKKMSPSEFLGMAMTSPEDPDWSAEFEVEHEEAVQYCIDEVKRIMSENNIKGGQLEVRVEIADDMFGTVDVLLYNDECVIVIDFKFGRGFSVEAEGNAQLMLYGIGSLRYIHENKLLPAVPKKAILVILQPRIPPGTRIWEVEISELKTWYTKSVKPAIAESKNGDAVCNPGEEQCKFCPANGVCTARADYLLGIAEQEFKEYAVTEPAVQINPPAEVETRDIATSLKARLDVSGDVLTPEIAGRILAYQPDFDNFFKNVGKYALNAALDGEKIPGFKLVYGRSNRKWKESVTAGVLETEFHINPWTESKLISPAQAEKQISKPERKALAELIYKPTGKIILVEDSDSREPVDLSGEEEMGEFALDDETVAGDSPDVFESNDKDTSLESIMDDVGVSVKVDKPEGSTILEGTGGTPPNKKTKKFQLLELGKEGGASIQEAADTLFKGERGQVIKGLNNLNARDGYTIIYDEETFTVKE